MTLFNYEYSRLCKSIEFSTSPTSFKVGVELLLRRGLIQIHHFRRILLIGSLRVISVEGTLLFINRQTDIIQLIIIALLLMKIGNRVVLILSLLRLLLF